MTVFGRWAGAEGGEELSQRVGVPARVPGLLVDRDGDAVLVDPDPVQDRVGGEQVGERLVVDRGVPDEHRRLEGLLDLADLIGHWLVERFSALVWLSAFDDVRLDGLAGGNRFGGFSL